MVASLSSNGVGKPTTLDMVLGLTLSGAGTTELLGTSLDHAVQAGRVSVIFQDGGPPDDFTAGETLRVVASMGPRYCDSTSYASRFDDVVDQASLGKLLIRKVSRRPGGERQRLRPAPALLPDPGFLVMDEPTVGMDVSARITFWEMMCTQTRRGRAVLFATHYPEEAASFADRIVIIAHGRLVTDGSVDEIRVLGEGALVTATWPGLSEESLGQRLVDCPAAGSIGYAVAHGEHVELCTTDFDAVARWLPSATSAEHPGIGVASLNEVFTALISDGSDETAPQRPEPHPST